MINSFTQGSKYLTAYMGSNNDPYFSMSAPSAGMLRYNGDSKNFEVYDGNMWKTMYGNNATVTLNPDAESAIEWAMKRMTEEREWQHLAETSSAVKIALENLEKAKQQLKVTATLAKEDNNSYGETEAYQQA